MTMRLLLVLLVLRRTVVRLDAAQCAAQLIEFPFVREFLALGHFDEFEDFIHLVVQFLQRVGDEGGVRDGFVDGGFLGRTKISRAGPLALRGRRARRRTVVATIIATVITARVAAIVPTFIPTFVPALLRYALGFRRGFRYRFGSRLRVVGFGVMAFLGCG
jgi:hypothetical protein